MEQSSQDEQRIDTKGQALSAPLTYRFSFLRAAEQQGMKEGELTLGGQPATAHLCWEHLRQREPRCGGGCGLAHLRCGEIGGNVAVCLRAVNTALGAYQKKQCTGCDREHPTTDALVRDIDSWWRARGAGPGGSVWGPPVWDVRTHARTTSAARGGSRSAISSGSVNGAAQPMKQPLSRAFLEEALARHRTDSEHIDAFMSAPYFETWMATDALRRLLSVRKRVKEITEAVALTRRVKLLLQLLGVQADGDGAVIFDCCSGKGMGSAMLSFELPRAKIVALDANGAMDCTHVQMIANLEFHHMDLFGPAAVRIIRDASAFQRRPECSVRILVGMHLCGALSPRIIDLFLGTYAHGLVVCPCCLKGELGAQVARAACHSQHNALLCSTLANLLNEGGDSVTGRGGDVCEVHRSSRVEVVVATDEQMLSPKNTFICAHR